MSRLNRRTELIVLSRILGGCAAGLFAGAACADPRPVPLEAEVAYDDPTIYSLRQEAMPADPRTNRRPRPAPPVWLVLGFAAACRRTTDAGDEEPAPAAVTCQPAVTPGLTALVAQRRDSP